MPPRVRLLALALPVLVLAARPAQALPTWTRWNTGTSLVNASAVWSTARSQLVVFGGYTPDGVTRSDVRIFDPASGAWGLLPVSGAIPARAAHTAWYDRRRDVMLVFGGTDGAVINNDLWQLDFKTDPPTWTKLAPAGDPPSPRMGHTMVWDFYRDRLLVYGGQISQGTTGDTWALDLTTSPYRWNILSYTEAGLSERQGHVAQFDPRNDRMIVACGWQGLNRCETSLLALRLGSDPPIWDGPGQYDVRQGPGSFFDREGCGFYVFSGRDCRFDSRNTPFSLWRLDATTGGQSPVSSGGDVPYGRMSAASAFDDDSRRYFVYGGTRWVGGSHTYHPEYQSDVAMLTLDPIVPWLVETETVTVDSAGAEVHWTVGAATGLPAGTGPFQGAIVERTVDADSAWTDFAHVRVIAEDLLAFTDTTTSPGHRYGYRLRWSQCATLHWSAATFVDRPALPIPPRIALAFGAGTGNPSRGDLTLRCDFPSGGNAVIELCEATGRTVYRSKFAVSAGSTPVTIPASAMPHAGIYFVRLVVGGDGTSLKFVRISGS